MEGPFYQLELRSKIRSLRALHPERGVRYAISRHMFSIAHNVIMLYILLTAILLTDFPFFDLPS